MVNLTENGVLLVFLAVVYRYILPVLLFWFVFFSFKKQSFSIYFAVVPSISR